MHQLSLFAPPVLQRRADVPAGSVFRYGGRWLRIVKTYGSDPAAPVIVEEIAESGVSLKGQFALWSADGVMRAAAKGWRP